MYDFLGFPCLGVLLQKLENPALRACLKVPSNEVNISLVGRNGAGIIADKLPSEAACIPNKHLQWCCFEFTL